MAEPLSSINPNVLRAVGFMAAATLANALMAAMVRDLSTTTELHPFVIAFYRCLFSLLTFAPVFLRRGWTPFRTKRLGLHAFRGGLNVLTMLAYFMALSMVPLAKIAALDFTGPLFATVLAVIFLGEVIRLRRIVAVIFGFCGALAILRPGIVELDNGALLALFAAFIWGGVLIAVKQLGKTETSLTTTIYMPVFVTPVALLAALPFWQWPSWTQLGWLSLIGITGALTHLWVAQSLRQADAGAVMPVQFMRLIWAAALGYMIFGEIPDVWTCVGGIMIFGAVLYITYRERADERFKTAADAKLPPVI